MTPATLAPVMQVLDTLGVRSALVGAHAMAARGYARFTADIDLLTTDRRVLDAAHWAALVSSGATVDPRRGDPDDPLAGVVHIQLADGTDIDLVVGRWAWQAALVARAEPMTLMGVVVAVPGTADLILLKLAAGGYIDRQDAASLLALGDRATLTADVQHYLATVYPDVQAAWHDLLASVPE